MSEMGRYASNICNKILDNEQMGNLKFISDMPYESSILIEYFHVEIYN